MTSHLTYAALLRSIERSHPVPCQQFSTPNGSLSRDSHTVLTLAMERGSQLMGMGLSAGDRVGIVVTDPWEFLPLVHGCLLFGLVAVPMYPPPPFSRIDTYRATLRGILSVASPRVIVTDAGLSARLGEMGQHRFIEVDQLPSAENGAPPCVLPSALALLQFTSGSTAEPRGVRISHRALMANSHAIMVDGLGATRSDHGVSWLPLYHDMGLIGFGLAPLLTQTPVTFIPTARFVRSPVVWLQTLSNTRATITFAPNFAYALATKRAAPEGLDLSRVRMWGCGAEPVSQRVLEDFERRFAANGVRSGSVSPCYGLAEATLAVTFTPPGGPRVFGALDHAKWEGEGVAQFVADEGDVSTSGNIRQVVSCGTPLAGYAVSVVDPSGRDVGERRAGEIVVRGPSLGEGYEGDAAASTLAFRAERLFTGDRGFVEGGQLFVTGRIKDTLIVSGRKYDPHVLEHCAEAIAGVRRAAAVNVPTENGEALVVLVECEAEKRDQLAEAVRSQIASHVGVAVTRVVCLAHGALPRTTSGKLRRGEAKRLAQLGDGL